MNSAFEWSAGRVRLRTFRPADQSRFLAYRADPEVARYQSWEPYSAEQATAFVLEQSQAPIPAPPGTWVQIGIALLATDELIGDCALCLSADNPRLAEVGFTVAAPWQGHGYGREAVRALLNFCFGELGLHRVMAITDCLNTGSVRLLESVGMRREGHFRQHVWFKGRWSDEYLYALLGEEWPAGNK
ncbi:GNAT family N-acetyltransferase [Hymenobacter sp. BT175]|uniref:GNAT family N-acetyltransferase n=1 Tax=Hymenobacter translucens TaxID=2886507 RepID=UPI001D0E102C|nr:GNAT family protein [Hymenobacter translucens]MCC2547759.1 GNAT family N-acetyltransferase [Hymenobacter translucens]